MVPQWSVLLLLLLLAPALLVPVLLAAPVTTTAGQLNRIYPSTRPAPSFSAAQSVLPRPDTSALATPEQSMALVHEDRIQEPVSLQMVLLEVVLPRERANSSAHSRVVSAFPSRVPSISLRAWRSRRD